jgi:hypothetical protein
MCQLQRMAATLCYGYYFAKDERIPDIHYCYSCLIGHEFDSDLMKQVVKLIRTRRTIYLVIITGATPTLNWQLVGQLSKNNRHSSKHSSNINKIAPTTRLVQQSTVSGNLASWHQSMAKRWNITIKLGNTKFCLNQTIPRLQHQTPCHWFVHIVPGLVYPYSVFC